MRAGRLRRHATGATLGAILLVAAYVRLSHPDLTWFSVDQGRDVYTALGIVTGRAFPLLGVEVAGGPAHTWGPAYYYLIALPFAVSRDPAFAVAVLSATNVAAIFVTYRLAAVFLGRAVALLSAALLATYPLAVIEAKALWNVAPLPLLAVAFFYALFSLVIQGRSAMFVAALAALGVLVQLHLSALSLGVVLAVTLVLFRPRVRGVHLVLGLGVLVVLLLPYLVTQGLGGWADLRAVAAASGSELRVRGPRALGELALGVLLASPDIVAAIPAVHETSFPGVLVVLHRLEAWTTVLGLAFVGLAALWGLVKPGARDACYPAFVLVALGFAVPFLMMGARSDTKPYYFNVAYPMPFVAAAVVVCRAVDRVVDRVAAVAGEGARRALWLGLGVVMAATIVVQVDFHRHVWRAIQTTGAITLTSPPLELMPMRDKARLAHVLVHHFGADSPDVFRRLHGSRARDWLEDHGYFFDFVTAAASPRPPAPPGPTLHYAIVSEELAGATPHGRRIAQVGPYTVVEYEPLIDGSAWRCTAGAAAEVTAEWTPLQLPTASLPEPGASGPIPFRRWPSQTVSCRGTLSVRSPPSPRLRIVVSLRTGLTGDVRVEALHLNGAAVAAGRLLTHATFPARNLDAVYDVTGHVREGANDVRVRVSGEPARFDLDVYEIQG